MTSALKPPPPPSSDCAMSDLKSWLRALLAPAPMRMRDIYTASGWTDPKAQKRIENALQRMKGDQEIDYDNTLWGLYGANFGPVVPAPAPAVPRVQPVAAAHVDAKTQAEHHATRAYLREQLAKIAGVPKAALAGLQDDQLAHAAHTQVDALKAAATPQPSSVGKLRTALGELAKLSPSVLAETSDDRLVAMAAGVVKAELQQAERSRFTPRPDGDVAVRALVGLAVDVGVADAEGKPPAQLLYAVQRAINDLRAEGDEADAALKAARAERNVALEQLSDVDRRLGLTDPHTVEERDLLIAELRAAAIDATSLQQRLTTAQDVIRRLEQDIAAANKEAADLRDTLIDVCGTAEPAEAQRAEPILPGWWDPDTKQPFPEWKVVHVVEIEESQKYLRDAQGEIQRLEGLLRRAEAQRQVSAPPAGVTPCRRHDQVVDDVWHALSGDLGELIMGGESTGAEIALRALGALHDAQKFLLALRVHHCGLVGPEVAA